MPILHTRNMTRGDRYKRGEGEALTFIIAAVVIFFVLESRSLLPLYSEPAVPSLYPTYIPTGYQFQSEPLNDPLYTTANGYSGETASVGAPLYPNPAYTSSPYQEPVRFVSPPSASIYSSYPGGNFYYGDAPVCDEIRGSCSYPSTDPRARAIELRTSYRGGGGNVQY